MTVCEILQYVRFLSNKSQKGNGITPANYNLILEEVNTQTFNEELRVFKDTGVIPETLRRFHTVVSSGTLATGAYTLPGAFSELITSTFTCTIGGEIRFGKFVSDSEAKLMLSKTQYRLDINPIAVLRSGTIQVYPTNAAGINFEYLRFPVKPVYDYYLTGVFKEVCLAVGEAHTLTGSETGSAGQSAPTGVTSNTVELDWDDKVHPRIVASILGKIGLNTREADVFQAAEAIKQQTR